MAESIEEEDIRFAAVESESHFVKVGCQMLRTDFMPCTHDATFQERESVLDGIGMKSSDNVDFAAVLDGFVFFGIEACFPHGKRIGRKIICDNDVRVLTDVFSNVLGESGRFGVTGMEESQVPVSLPDANDDVLILGASPTFTASFPSADVGFVHFESSRKWVFDGFLHSCPDTVAEIPGRLVTYADGSLNLAGGHTFLGFTEQERGEEPLFKWKVSIVKNRPCRDRELVITPLAVEELFFSFQSNGFSFTTRTADTFGPAKSAE